MPRLLSALLFLIPLALHAEPRLVELEEQVKELDTELRRERGKVQALSQKGIELEKMLSEAESRILVLEKEVAELKEALGTEKELSASRAMKIEMLEKELAAAKARIAELEALLARERESMVSLTTQLSALKERVETLIREKGSLEARVESLLTENGRLQATVESTRESLKELEKRKAEADARIAEFKALLDKFRSLIDAGKLRVKIVEGRMVVELATDILFGSGSASLSKSGQAAIREVALILATIPERSFQIEGHTDNVPIATQTFPSNWELASARALTVLKTMVQSGMPASRISAASYGEVKPAASNETKEGRAANRRIEIVVVPDLSSLPGFEELSRVSEAP